MLMDFIKMNIQKLNIPKLINACERPNLSCWVYLQILSWIREPDVVNITKLSLNLSSTKSRSRHYHWEHAVFLYTHYDEFDQAANTMMAGDLSAVVPWIRQIPEYRVHDTFTRFLYVRPNI